MPSSYDSGTVRVTAPASYAVGPDAARGERALGEPDHAAATDILVRALEQSEMTLVDRVDVAPQRTRDLDKPVPNRKGRVTVDVDVPAGEDAVVLLERDGVYSWHLPVNPLERTKDLLPGPRTARFEIDVQPRRTGATPKATARRDRGLLGSLVQGAATALVFTFVAPPLVKKAVEHAEAHVRTGLVHLTADKVSAWKRFETLDELDLPKDRPVRLLLFIHGTFSSTVGGFGALAVEKDGKGFLRTAIAAYDAVIGYDHKTLSLDPRQNAEDLVERLRTHQPGAELVIDIVTHSRGGLTTRAFAEEVLPGSGWSAQVDRVVFVASTHAGTHLASPENWGNLVDLYTNLAAVSARLLSTLPGAAPVATVVAGVVKGIGAFVKALVSYLATGDEVPGLAAMVPGGAFVKEINKTQPGQPGKGTNWYVVSSDFEVSLFDDHHNPPEFPKELAAKLKDGFADQLLKGANDLVVDVASMSAIDLPEGGGFVRDTLALGKNDVTYHNNYFNQRQVIEALGGWLPLGMGAAGEPEASPDRAVLATEDESTESPDAPMAMAPADDELGEGPVSAAPPPAAAPLPEPSPAPGQSKSRAPGAGKPAARKKAAPKSAASKSAASKPRTTSATLAAEMPASVVAKKVFQARVRLSRKKIAATAGSAHAEAEIEVDASRELSVQVVGKKNATIVGSDQDVFDLPAGGGTSELTFDVKATAAGPVTVSAVVRQGTVPLSTLTLEAVAVGKAADVSTDTTTTVSTHPGVDAPELEGLACLDIFERELPNGAVSYQYAVRLEPGKPAAVFESKPIKDRVRRIGTILDSVAEVWRTGSDDPKERERKLQDIGATMFDELFPPDMQAHLWKHRAKVHDLIVYADEPFVPWELVHLKPPNGPRQTTPRFLAQGGLVRWQLGSFPPQEMRVRSGKARSLCPAYLDPRFALTEPVHEQQFLADRFGASKVTATPAGVRTLLRSGKFDLLHFSGHGAADPDDILDAKVLLRGLRNGDDVEPQYLGATTVSENAAWASKGDPGPVVVLNACQTGQAGELLTTVGGFAKAFLDAGASAFVSCLWSVHEQPSRIFVEKLYEELLAGEQMSVAATRAREAARTAGDASWLAFVVYARPDAVLVHG